MATGDRAMIQTHGGMARMAQCRAGLFGSSVADARAPSHELIGTRAHALIWRVVLAAALTMVLIAGRAPTAVRHAAAAGAAKSAAPLHLYWANDGGVTIGRSWLDGSHVNNSFITGGAAPERMCGVVIAGKYLYWGFDVQSGTPTVGRARLDGSGVNEYFLPGANYGPDCTMAADRRYVYWGSYAAGEIGRAKLDGSGVEPNFIGVQGIDPSLNAPCVVCVPTAVAVDGKHIYWGGVGSIGRANLDGTHVQPKFINGVDNAGGIAVTSNYIYWGDMGGSFGGAVPAWANRPSLIGRARLDGTHVQLDFIKGQNLDGPCGLAITGKYIYWGQNGPGGNGSGSSVGRANLDGTGVQSNLIAGLPAPCGVAVGP